MSLRRTKKQATAANIRAVARDLFLQQGYEAISVEAIAAAAGISRASLFNYYRGKPAILDGLGAEMEERLLQLARHYLAKPLSTSARLQQFFGYSGKILEQTGELVRLVFVNGTQGAGFPALQPVLVELVGAGQKRGDVRADIAAEALAELVYLAFAAGLLGWCRQAELSLEAQMNLRAETLGLLLASA